MDDASVQLLGRYREGDQDAAEELFHRYVDRLIGLARNRISSGLARRVDAEDVVQSVYRSFFVHAQEDKYVIERAGDLWRLLAAITVNKVRKKARFHGQQKRAMNREKRLQSGAGASAEDVELFADGPATPDAVAVVDELEAVMSESIARCCSSGFKGTACRKLPMPWGGRNGLCGASWTKPRNCWNSGYCRSEASEWNTLPARSSVVTRNFRRKTHRTMSNLTPVKESTI